MRTYQDWGIKWIEVTAGKDGWTREEIIKATYGV